MAVIVKGGGGAVRQEKTVTAATSVVDVLPDEGKLLSKVTVNPTPSQSKTVTAGTAASSVTPDSGNLLSSVTVNPTPSQSKTATPATTSQTISPDEGKLLSSVVVNAMPSGSATTPATTKQQSQPSISIDSAGKITASVAATSVEVTPTVSAGYVSAGTKGTITMSANSNTHQMTTKAATTYNASTSDQTIATGTYLTGTQTIRKITTSNISAANIKNGVVVTVGDSGSSTRIANVTGTYTSDATATAADIISGKTAYAKGSKLTGTAVAAVSIPVSSLSNTGSSATLENSTTLIGNTVSVKLTVINATWGSVTLKVAGFPKPASDVSATFSNSTYGAKAATLSTSGELSSVKFSTTSTAQQRYTTTFTYTCVSI